MRGETLIDAMVGFPEKCPLGLEALGKVYHRDEICKQQGMRPTGRLGYHQVQSVPVMKALKQWLSGGWSN